MGKKVDRGEILVGETGWWGKRLVGEKDWWGK